MIRRSSPRPLVAALLSLALAAGSLSATAVPAGAGEPVRVPLAETVLPASASGTEVLGATRGDIPVDPTATRFAAVAGVETTSAVATPLETRYEVVAAPDGGALDLRAVGPDQARTPWHPGDALAFASGEVTALAWTFATPGSYTVRLTASAPRATTDAGAPADAQTPPSPSAAVSTEYVFEVSAPPALEPPAPSAQSADPAPAASASASPPSPLVAESPAPEASALLSAPPPGEPAPARVVANGGVRIATAVESGRLVQRLVVDGETRDLATTVLALPAAEAWPGSADGENAAAWERIAPARGEVWRTAVDGRGANPVPVVLDSAAIGPDVLWDDASGFGGRVLTRLGGIDGPATSGLLLAGADLSGLSTRPARENTWIRTSDPRGMGLYPAEQPVALGFSAPGRYCATLQTTTQLATGAVLNNDLTLTLAVGDVDPARVEPCAQPEPIAPHGPAPTVDAGTGTAIVDGGLALLGSTLTDGALSLDVITDDRGRTARYDPARVVFSLPNQDSRWPWAGRSRGDSSYPAWQRLLAEGTRGYRTPGLYAGDGTDERANELVLDLEARFVDGALLSPRSGVAYQFRGATSSGPGYLATYRQNSASGAVSPTDDAGFWDSRPGGARRDQQVGVADPAASSRFYAPLDKRDQQGVSALGTVFSAAGVYCATVRTSALLASGEAVSDTATFTFAVGVDPAGVAPCAQVAGEDPGGPGPGPGPGAGGLDPTVTYYRDGHLDLAAAVRGGALTHRVLSDAGHPEAALRDAVWVGRGAHARHVVPEPDRFQDLTFLGPPGTPWYGWRQGGSDVQSETIWPGISMTHLPVGYSDRDGTWTLSKQSGPGDVFVWSGNDVYLNSAAEASTSFRLGVSHVHQNWAFTRPGVYCLGVHTSIRPAGSDADARGSGVLTVAVGDVDLATVQPCERTRDVPTRPLAAPVDDLSGTFSVVSRAQPYASLGLARVAGSFRAVTSVRSGPGQPLRHRDAADVVYDLGPTADTALTLRWSALLDTDAVSDDVTVTVGAVTGAGDYVLSGLDPRHTREPVLDTRAGQRKDRLTLWPRHMSNALHRVTATGVTCVPLTFSGTTTDGARFSVATTLTMVAGVDASTVTPCSRGGGTDPGGGGGTPAPRPVWDVPNGTVNARGATVVNDGHVDLASLLEDGRLVTRIRDSATGPEPVWRGFDRTVLQLTPATRASVPAGDAWSFLGASGSTVYQVTQTPQDGLVWPGWSTEAIPTAATTGGVAWALTGASGPGAFALYETGDLGRPRVLFDTRDGITAADRTTIPKNTHAHGSWAFSAEGNYCLSMQRTAELADGRAVSDTVVLAVAVGTADVMAIDPARCGESVATGPVDLAPPARDTPSSAAPAARQLAATTCTTGATVLSAGHVDYATRLVDGRLRSLVGDDSSGAKVFREPGDVVLRLPSAARVVLPPGYGPVGAAGIPVWQIPQTQNPGLIWLGWSTEALNAGTVRGPVQWTIDRVDGPGPVTVYLAGAFGGVQQVVFRDAGGTRIPLGVHAHATWAFGAEGVYRMTMTQTATLADGRASADTQTLTIVVGDVDPATAVRSATGCGAVAAALRLSDPLAVAEAPSDPASDAAGAEPRALPVETGSPAAAGLDPFAAWANGDPVPLLLLILGALLALAAAGTGTLWWRRRARAPRPGPA